MIKGEGDNSSGTTVYDKLHKPSDVSTVKGYIADATDRVMALVAQNKKKSQALSLIQGTISLALWPEFVDYGKVCDMWDELEKCFRKAGGASTYLQVVNMMKANFTNSSDLLLQIQELQQNYQRIRIMMNSGHNKLINA